jgi:hypothetical protein
MKQSHVGGQQYAGPNPEEKNAFASDKCSLLYGENNITSEVSKLDCAHECSRAIKSTTGLNS